MIGTTCEYVQKHYGVPACIGRRVLDCCDSTFYRNYATLTSLISRKLTIICRTLRSVLPIDLPPWPIPSILHCSTSPPEIKYCSPIQHFGAFHVFPPHAPPPLLPSWQV